MEQKKPFEQTPLTDDALEQVDGGAAGQRMWYKCLTCNAVYPITSGSKCPRCGGDAQLISR